MSDKKNASLIPENHDFLKRLAYLNDSTIELELNKIISEST